MRWIAGSLFIAASLLAQTAPRVAITVTAPGTPGGNITFSQSVQLRGRTLLAGFSCAWAADGMIEPGDPPVVCTLTANQQVRNGLVVAITYPSGLTGPATVTIPNAASTATFTITAVDLPVSAALLAPVAWSIWPPMAAAEHYAALVLPCCARADSCGLAPNQVLQQPCAQ